MFCQTSTYISGKPVTMSELIALVSKKISNPEKATYAMLTGLEKNGVTTFTLASHNDLCIRKTVKALHGFCPHSPVMIGQAFSRILKHDNSQPIKTCSGTMIFNGRIYGQDQTKRLCAFKEKLEDGIPGSAMDFIRKTDGDFIFVIAKKKELLAGSDSLGVRPFYWGENEEFVALASQRKALWKIGITDVTSFPPGHVATLNKNGIRFAAAKKIVYPRRRKTNLEDAVKTVSALLERSVEERVHGLKKVAVAFSGGLDSSLIAFLAGKHARQVHLIHVSLENRPEIEFAQRAAEALHLPLHLHIAKKDEVEETALATLRLIEEPDVMKVSVGVPFYWMAKQTSRMEIPVVLAGQGADELFGGYKRYVDEFLRNGTRVERLMRNDIVNMFQTNFDRDFKICSNFGLELRLPFASYELVRFAMSMPVALKISSDGISRKLILMKVAEELGLDPFIANKAKKAIQYSTGVAEQISKLAQHRHLTNRAYLDLVYGSVFGKMMKIG